MRNLDKDYGKRVIKNRHTHTYIYIYKIYNISEYKKNAFDDIEISCISILFQKYRGKLKGVI